MLNFVSVKCPDCGANLSIEEGRDTAFCTYCGAKVIINNENEYIYRHIDEAGVKRAETEHVVRMRQMELAEKRRQAKERKTKIKIITSISFAVVGILMMSIGGLLGSASGDSDSGFYMLSLVGFFPLMGAAYIWLFSNNKEDEEDEYYGDMVKVPSSIEDYEKKNYSAVEAILRSAGFSNIRSIPLNDLTIGFFKRPGMVESVSINGKEIDTGGKRFPRDAEVIISYHSLPGRE